MLLRKTTGLNTKLWPKLLDHYNCANSLNIFPASLRSPCDQASLPIKIIVSNESQEAKYLAVPLLRGLELSRLQIEIERISFDLT